MSRAMKFGNPAEVMQRAVDLARQGAGSVEPNPMVGAVIVDDDLQLIGEGWHARFGGPHAEIAALAQAGDRARGATLFVTLEPCAHFGKTPPCAQAVIRAGLRRVIVGLQDPNPQVAGRGLDQLRQAGIAVEVGLLERECRQLIAPFRMLMEHGRPYVHAKWAMTLDGKIAAHTGVSQWISNAASRAVVHALRGRMDGILVGAGTLRADDPLLTARPPGPRLATRIVLDPRATLPLNSQLLRTITAAPVLLACGAQAPAAHIAQLQSAGVEVLVLPDEPTMDPARPGARLSLTALLEELGRRRFTNLLVEGGSHVLGSFFDQQLIDELHVFLAPKLLGGAHAPSPLAGHGLPAPTTHPQLENLCIQHLDGDIYIQGTMRPVPGR